MTPLVAVRQHLGGAFLQQPLDRAPFGPDLDETEPRSPFASDYDEIHTFRQ